MIKLKLSSVAETYALAAILAELGEEGDVITLSGDLGAGKSEFARAFIQAAVGSKIVVPSPTFTLLQQYEGKRYAISHFDLYRLEDPEEVYELGLEEALIEGLTLIEWPEKLGTFSFDNHLAISIQIQKSTQNRLFILNPDESWMERINTLELGD